MTRLLALLALLPSLALAQGVQPPPGPASIRGKDIAPGWVTGPTEVLLWSTGNFTASTNMQLGGRVLGRAFKITKFDGQCSGSSGGGVGNTVGTITDGTNTCTFTIACASSNSCGSVGGVSFNPAATNGAGTGCTFAANAVLLGYISTAGCTTTQPNMKINVVGNWQ